MSEGVFAALASLAFASLLAGLVWLQMVHLNMVTLVRAGGGKANGRLFLVSPVITRSRLRKQYRSLYPVGRLEVARRRAIWLILYGGTLQIAIMAFTWMTRS